MPGYQYEFVKVRIQDGIAWAALNRPRRAARGPGVPRRDGREAPASA